MANATADYGMQPGQRPRATVESYRLTLKAEPQAQTRNTPRPKFSSINAGQFFRTVVIVMLVLGVFEVSHPEKADAEGRGAAATFGKRS